ncbi:uncharacterized protein LOC100899361 [Galendromus occidentalis]|uniref:tryptophan--tRNA ligase n=1 Tax=Galendromus occidentalis TaxID=34638 RepID=A0AAJ6QRR7_9ACAR|nr:uncharacterized protein LOC100899361 [Galendromus occidentalis]
MKAASALAKFPRRVYSGIQPTGVPHLGNYFGAINQWIKLQKSSDCLICVVDLHSVTIPHYDPPVLRSNIELMTASLLACGVNADSIYLQSLVPEHGQLAWMFNCISTMNRMYHFPQFKEKSTGMKETPLGLYLYPLLQAADVLLFKGTHVPVGEDQLPHIHLIKDIAETFNKRFGKTVFPYCEPLLNTDSARVRDLKNPEKKMSKSALPHGRIDITDPPDTVRNKIRKAMTDCTSAVTFNPTQRPGVSNLVLLHSLCSGQSIDDIVRDAKELDTGKYKGVVAEAVVEFLNPIRERTEELNGDKQMLWQILRRNAERVRVQAAQTLEEARVAMGMDHAPAPDSHGTSRR